MGRRKKPKPTKQQKQLGKHGQLYLDVEEWNVTTIRRDFRTHTGGRSEIIAWKADRRRTPKEVVEWHTSQDTS